MPTQAHLPYCPQCKNPTSLRHSRCRVCGREVTAAIADTEDIEPEAADEPDEDRVTGPEPGLPPLFPSRPAGTDKAAAPNRDDRVLAIVVAVFLVFFVLAGWLFLVRGVDDGGPSTTATASGGSGAAQANGSGGAANGATTPAEAGTALPYPGAWTDLGADGVRSYVEIFENPALDRFFAAFVTTSSRVCAGRPAFAFVLARDPDAVTSRRSAWAFCSPPGHDPVVPLRFDGSCDPVCSVVEQTSRIEWEPVDDAQGVVLSNVIDCLGPGSTCWWTRGSSPMAEMRFGDLILRP